MKTRIISGACYVVIIAGCFLLREFVDFRLFNLLLWFFATLGTLEVAEAVNKYTTKKALIVAGVFGGLSVPAFCLIEHFFAGWGFIAPIALSVISGVILFVLTKRKSKRIFCLLPAFYPSLLILTSLMINYLQGVGFIATLTLFVIAPLADSFAYFLGTLIGGKKLCPKLSPKKTWAGAFGSVLGGAMGGLAVYFVFGSSLNVRLGYVLFAIIGVVASVLTIFGDLFASLIKRKVGIKDYGNIMPGHGGVMDRIDGMIFSSPLILVAFSLI